jgi:hypothetical protein
LLRKPFSAGGVGYFANGGPQGTDTIPAWLTPGEFVMNSKATQQWMPWLQMMNAGHFAEGTPQPVQPPQPVQGAPAPKPAPPPPAPKTTGGSPPPGAPTGGPPPQQGTHEQLAGIKATSDMLSRSGNAQPGGQDPNQQPGSGLPASPGIGFSGGIIGAAESMAAAAATMGMGAGMASGGPVGYFADGGPVGYFADGGSSGGGGGGGGGGAMQLAFQELNRTAAYGAQVGGILAGGLLESLIPTAGGPGMDWMKTIPGRLLAGVAGVRPTGQNTAGKTPSVNPPSEDPSTNVGVNIHGDMHVHAADPQVFQEQMRQDAQMAGNTHTFNGGR